MVKNVLNIDNKQITNILLITDKDEINAIAFIQQLATRREKNKLQT